MHAFSLYDYDFCKFCDCLKYYIVLKTENPSKQRIAQSWRCVMDAFCPAICAYQMIKRVIGPILQKFWATSFLLNVFEIAMHMLYWYLDLQATLKVYWILEIAFSKWFCLQNTYHNKRQEWGPGQDFRNWLLKMVLFAKYITHEKRQDWDPEQDGNNYLDCFYSKATPVPLYWFPTIRK